MTYHVVFDVTQTGYRHWQTHACAALFVGLGMGTLWYSRRACGSFGAKGYKQFALMLCLMGIGAVVMFGLDYEDYLSLQSALRQSKCQVVEGTVTNYHWMTIHRHSDEVFFVNGNRFEYWQDGGQNGFNQGGIIRDGVPVRVYYVGQQHPDIARLEVAP
jgi:hypothetical protein